MTKRFIVMDERRDGTGDLFDEAFETKEEAILEANAEWVHLTERERKARHIYVLESVAESEEDENYYDGDIVWEAEDGDR